MNILISGKKWFGKTVYEEIKKIDRVKIVCVSAGYGDALRNAAERDAVLVIKSLNSGTCPSGIDLIVAAHSHEFISEKVRLMSTYGGIGYHPSLLPVHRGRDAIKWAIRMGDRVTGGTVYRLSNKMDGGNIVEQKHCFIRKDDDAVCLWRRELAPLGVSLLVNAVKKYRDNGFIAGERQDEELATWEPSIKRPPLFRPDLVLIGHDKNNKGR